MLVELTLDGEIPLIGLRIAVIGINTLIEATAAVLHAHRGRRGVGELDQRRAIRGHAVGISVQRGRRVAAVVKRQRAKIGDGKDPEACADDRLRIVERTVRKREARLKIARISVAQRLRQVILAGGNVVRAGQRGVAEIAGVERLLKGEVRGLDVLLRQIRSETVRARRWSCFSDRSLRGCRRLRAKPGRICQRRP